MKKLGKTVAVVPKPMADLYEKGHHLYNPVKHLSWNILRKKLTNLSR